MRSGSFALLAALTTLICGLFSAAPAAAGRMITDLDGHDHTIDFSTSIPGQLNYQGFLANAVDSSAVTATLEMTFRLFDSETKGAELWAEIHPMVAVGDGLFQVLLGSITPFPDGLFDGSEMWLQTEVGTEILSPRKPLVSVAYSHRTNSAEMLENNTLTDLDDRWVNEEDLDHLDAADGDPADVVFVDAYGKVGVGTTNPLTELDVSGSVNATAYYGDGSNLTGVSGTTDADWTISGNHMSSAVPGSVGIGTSNPENKLHVAGDVKATTYYGDGSNLTGISGTTDNDWTISGDDVYHEVGNVGIGTASPSTMLDVNGAVNTDSLYKIGGQTVLSTAGAQNISVGIEAGANSMTSACTFLGYRAGANNEGIGNTFIGCSAGDSNTTGAFNTFVGDWTGRSNTEGDENTFVGVSAGQLNTIGTRNTFIGKTAGFNNIEGNHNTFVGVYAGLSNTSGLGNTFIGNSTGTYTSKGSHNTFLGNDTGQMNNTGENNTFLGMNAGKASVAGSKNTYLGQGAGFANTDGSWNTCIGSLAGAYVTLGSYNVFLGYQAGQNETGSHKLYIANGADTSDVLIYGDFSTGNVGLGTLDPDTKLEVQGGQSDYALIKIDQRGSREYSGLRLDREDNEKWFVGMSDINDNLTFRRSASSNDLIIDTTGNVGIGKPNPYYKLEVNGAVSTDSVYKIGGNTVLSTEGNGNLFVGWGTGWSNTTGQHNTFVGQSAGHDNTEGEYNTFIGRRAGYSNTYGFNNTIVGEYAGHQSTEGNYNTFLGNSAGYNNTSGHRNTFVGEQAGFATTTGSGNVFIGCRAGWSETGSNKLYIANHWDTSSVLIYGDFSNGNVGLGTLSPERKLHLVGANPRILIEASSSNPEVNFSHSGEPWTSTWSLYKEGSSGDLRFGQNGDRVTIEKNTGNMGIGTTNPVYKLDVAGDINTTGEIRRNGSLYNHPDYVFAPDYELMSLPQLRDYVTENNHLPNMPSAEEVKADGVMLFEHNRLMLEKLEEAYLYILALEERIVQLEAAQR
jgi:hypothetical protein